jgi:hypothetical protein
LTDPPGFFVAVLDIRSLDELTDEGCDVLGTWPSDSCGPHAGC